MPGSFIGQAPAAKGCRTATTAADDQVLAVQA
jgi:hypothetical protein